MPKILPSVCISENLKIGKKRAVREDVLAKRLGITPQQIRDCAKRELRNGVPICAVVKKTEYAYYLAGDKEDLNTHCYDLSMQAYDILKERKAYLRIEKNLPGEDLDDL